jgi:hypothetical protein
MTLETSVEDWEEYFEKSLQFLNGSKEYDEDSLLLLGAVPTGEMVGVKNLIKAAQFGVVILDCWSQVAPECGSDQLSQTRAIKELTAPFIDAGASVVLISHATKGIEPGTMPTLGDVAGGGIGRYCRGWLLLNRREEYDGDGHHKLIASSGTRGRSRRFNIDFDEIAWEFQVSERNQSKKPGKPASPARWAAVGKAG